MAQSIVLREVRKLYGDFVAVRKLDLSVDEGEFLTLLGPSGCGKTTTLRLIAGFEIPDEGEVWIDDDFVNATPPYRRHVNTVFQNYALFPHLTIFENVAYGLKIQRMPRAEIRRRVEEMLDLIGLEGKAQGYPRELSGGQQQRVALARALVNRPRVLLLDEPLGALDARLRRTMQVELKQIQREFRTTFLYVTHDQEEALVMSDRIAVMNEGNLVQLGSPREIYEKPNCRFVADFIGTVNFLEGRVRENRDGESVIELDAGGDCTARYSLAPDTRVTVAVRPQRLRVRENGSEEPRSGLSVRGRLQEIAYAGPVTRLIINVGTAGATRSMVLETAVEDLPIDVTALHSEMPLELCADHDAIMVYEE